MKQGIPLIDAGREPWLRDLRTAIEEWKRQAGHVLACSALKAACKGVLTCSPKGSKRGKVTSLILRFCAASSRRWNRRNALLVDASRTPQEIVEAILKKCRELRIDRLESIGYV